MAKRFNFRKFGVTVLTLILVVSLLCGTMSIGIFASGTKSYNIGDYAYTDSKDTVPEGNIPANAEWKFIKMIPAEYDCGKEEHRHNIICRYLGDCEEHSHKEDGCNIVTPEMAQWQLVENTDSALHLDIHIALNATYILDGEPYSANVQLEEEDYYNGNLSITATVPFEITGTEIYDAGQRRFNGDFPVGTSANPVYYTISLFKDVEFNINGEVISVPMTFSKTVHFWHSDNICETIRQSSSRLRDWKAGKFVYGGMDFKLGASQTATTPEDPVNPPEEPVLTEATVTIQKNVTGIKLDANKEYVFGVYNVDGDKIDTVRLIVQAGGENAIGTTVLDLNETYYVVEEGNPDIEGYIRTTTATVEGNTVDGETSASFTLEGDTAVVFVNSYELEIVETEPVETEPVETEPVETEPVETEPVETEPVETDPVETEPVETEPVETEPVETEPVETEPVETDPVETEPVETEPVETEPVETEPVETDPVETEPVETEPVETEPVETEPVETEPVETEPVETEPVETEPVETEPVETEPEETDPRDIPSPVETFPYYTHHREEPDPEPEVTEPEPEVTEPEPEITEPEPEITEPEPEDTTSDVVDIPDETVPLTDIPDEDVPLTGDSIVWYVIAALSGIGLLILKDGKKKKEKA